MVYSGIHVRKLEAVKQCEKDGRPAPRPSKSIDLEMKEKAERPNIHVETPWEAEIPSQVSSATTS